MPVFVFSHLCLILIFQFKIKKNQIVVLVTVKVILSCHTLHRLYKVVNNNSKCKAN